MLTIHLCSYAGMYIVRVVYPAHELKLKGEVAAIHHQTLFRTPETTHQPGQNRNRERCARERLCVRVSANRMHPSASFFPQVD